MPLPAAAENILGEAPKLQACLDTSPPTGKSQNYQSRTDSGEVLRALLLSLFEC